MLNSPKDLTNAIPLKEFVKNTSENINNFLSLTKNKNLLFASSVHDPSNFFWKENLDIYNQINLTIERE